MRHGDKIRHGNPCSNARLNCQKSAEAIAGRLSMTSAEGPNVRRSQKLAVLDGYAKKAENLT